MGKRGKPQRSTGVTDMGPAFGKLAPANKAEEFDASYRDPVGYAQRNFTGRPSKTDQYDAIREQQRQQQEGRK